MRETLVVVVVVIDHGRAGVVFVVLSWLRLSSDLSY